MRRASIFPYLGPALVLYLVADVSSASAKQGARPLDLFGHAIAALAVLLSCALLRRHDPQSAERGASRASWLGFVAGVSLLRLLRAEPMRISVDIAEALALATLGALCLDLALSVPDAIVPARYRRYARIGVIVPAAVCALASGLALAPEFSLFGGPVIVPAHFALAAAGSAGVSVCAALGLRLTRRRLGSAPEALASNAWALLALAPGALFACVLLALPAFGMAPSLAFLRGAGALSAIFLYLGHVWLVDPERRLSAGPTLRDFVAALLGIGGVSMAAMPLAKLVPQTPLAFALWIAATLCVGLAAVHAVSPVVHRALAPARGRLLDALRDFPQTTTGVHTLAGLARVVLGSQRRASGSPTASPLLYGFDPAFEARIDAAGEAHLSARTLHPAIMERLRAEMSSILVRAPLEAQIVRNPPLRPLIEALVELEALCVVPLVSDGELEGALIVPRGTRGSQLTLEELSALREHGRYLSALLSVFSSQGRTEARAQSLLVAHEREESRAERLEDELQRLRRDLELLQGERSARAESGSLIAYSPAMRALVERVRGLAALDVPLCLIAEPGTPIEPIARFLHGESGRGAEPFLVVSCAALRADESLAVLFGGEHGSVRHAGALRVAGAGTLLLLDVPALAPEAQRQLAAALASRSARTADGGEPYAVQVRFVFGTRVAPDALAAQGRFDAELAARLTPLTTTVPALRECLQDLESHALLAVDRACRRLGREPLGLDREAFDALLAHPWPENHDELERVIDRAVARASGARLSVSDLALDPSALPPATVEALSGTLEEVERRALEHALARAGGNKSETARLLGLPRTTLLDKLRRHKLDDGARESSTPAN